MIWGIFLTWFADALLFDMMINTSYEDGVNSLQDFIDRDMYLGDMIYTMEVFSLQLNELLTIFYYRFQTDCFVSGPLAGPDTHQW